jgi:Meckel syndrome type 1 protein
MNTHDHHDDDSLPGEDELKALYDSLPRKEPSPSLDQAVRRAAADAVRPAKRRSRWPMTAASAAVLMLAAGISWHLHEQSSSNAPPPASTIANDRAPAPAAPASKVMTESAGATASAPAPEPPTTAIAPRAHETIRSALKPRVLAAAPTARRTTPVSAPPPPDQSAAESAPLPAPPAPAAAQAYAPSPMAKQARGSEDAVRTMATRMMAAPAPAITAAPDPTAADPADSPEQELDKIRALFAQQRRDEALQRLTAFRQAHPDMPVPDDLQNQQAHHE